MDIPAERKKLDIHLLKASTMLIAGMSAFVIAAGDLWGWHGVALSLGGFFAFDLIKSRPRPESHLVNPVLPPDEYSKFGF